MLRKGIILLYDMHPSQCACTVLYELCCMCCKVLNHPLYDLVLPLYHFCMPGPLMKVLKAMYLGQTRDMKLQCCSGSSSSPGSYLLWGSVSWFSLGCCLNAHWDYLNGLYSSLNNSP